MFDVFMFKYHFFLIFALILILMKFWVNSMKTAFISTCHHLFFFNMMNLKMMKWNKNYIYFMFILFSFIFFMNFIGILPYCFTLTSQMSLVLMISSSIWLMLNIWNLIKNYKGFVMHTVPEGTPTMMIIFLFMVELISNFIRPFTLTLRLVGNMVAGHILLSLIFMLINKILLGFVVLYVFYMLVEFIVSILQAYIITTLTIMYYSEV